MMPASSSARIQKRRAALRKAGLRPVQIWVPDIRSRRFVAECRRQSRLAAEADQQDRELLRFLEGAPDDMLRDRP